NIPTGQAKDFIEAYFARYPKIQEYLDRTLVEARATGKVTTLFGRVRYIPEIHNKSFTVRGNAERMATNAPIQGTAADLLKLAMIALDERLETDGRMLLTVHAVIANGRARSGDELDAWRLFDLANGRVTFVSDVERTYRTVPLAQLEKDLRGALDDPLPADLPRAQIAATKATKTLQGVAAAQSV